MNDYKPTTSVAMKPKGDKDDILPVTKDDSKGKMLAMLRHLYKNIFALGNALQDSRPDISQRLDMIIEGCKWDTKGLGDRYANLVLDGKVIQYDKNTQSFFYVDLTTGDVSEMFNALNSDDVKKLLTVAKK